jgi:acyl-CoA synthetase (AMP-forming)/AMP-acid ligase II
VTTIAELLELRRDDGHRALVFEGDTWTWSELVDECGIRAALLAELREAGPFHVGVLLDNVPEFLFLLGAAALGGATIVGINSTRRGAELARDVRHTDCQLVVTDTAHAPLLDGLDLGVAPERVLLVDTPEWTARLERHRPPSFPSALPGEDALWVLIFTSGSTGAPKAVRATQGRLAVTSGMGFGPDDVLYCAMPLFHGNALSANVIPALKAGATIVLRRTFSASGFLPDVREHGVTYFNTVGRALSYILATRPTPHDRDHHVKFALGPESSAPDIAAFKERFGILVIEGYGSSEGAIRMSPFTSRRTGALGKPDPDADVVVVDPETMQECPRAQFDDQDRLTNAAEAIGEIVRRDGVSRFEGYYNNDAANAERTRNGWFWSGDLAYRDEDGVFYFAGRNADWVRVDGENFAAAPVERIITRHDDVAGVAVFGVPDVVTGDQVMAAVELHAGRAFDPDAFAAFLAAQPDLGTKWTPRFVRVVDRLPVTATDKVNKQPLRATAWRTDDEVWYQPARGQPYRRLTADDVTALDAGLAANGRADLLPSR